MRCDETGACGNGEENPILIATHKLGSKELDFNPSPFLDNRVQDYLNAEYTDQFAAEDMDQKREIDWTYLKEQSFLEGNNFYYDLEEKMSTDSKPPSAYELTTVPTQGNLY